MLIATWVIFVHSRTFSGCHLSQQLSQKYILLTTIKLKTFQDYFVVKNQGFQSLEFGPITFKGLQDFQGPVRTLQRHHADGRRDNYLGVSLKGYAWISPV